MTTSDLPTAAPLVEFTLVPKGTMITAAAALTIEQAFAPYVEEFKALSAHVSTITDPKEAKVTRLKLRKVRTDTEKKHQEMKAESLNYGRTLDHAKNLINGQIEPIEEQLRAIEEAEERRIAALIADRRQKHLAALAPYLDPSLPAPFVDGITDDQFATMLDNAKVLHQAKIDRQQREERERQERDAADAERRRKEQEELDRLREEALQQQETLRKERAEQDRLRAEQEERHRKEQAAKDAEAKHQKEIADTAAKKIKDAADAKLKKEREAAELKLAEERAKREELGRQQQALIEAENQRRAEEERRQQEAADAAERAAQAPDKEKIIIFCRALMRTPIPAVTSKKAKRLLSEQFSEIQTRILALENDAAKL